ncbi:MAG: hypothetical protein U0V73_00700 [Acidimicrobiia bacterium]
MATPGGNIVVQDTVIAQFGDTVRPEPSAGFGGIATASSIRSHASEPTVDDALAVAREAVDRTGAILREAILGQREG